MKNLRKYLKVRYFRRAVIYLLTYCMVFNTSIVLAVVPPAPGALPSGGSVPTGGGSVGEFDYTIDNQLHLRDVAERTIINWDNFDIGSDALVQFHQLGTNPAVLNRITGGDVTGIYGQLLANGNVFIVNPAGVVFGADSYINVNQLVASSLDIADSDFMTSNYEFLMGDGVGEIINNGWIDAVEGIALLGKRVLNNGIIETEPGGFVVMAAGDRVLLGQPGSKILVEMDSVTVTDPENPDNYGDVINDGEITAHEGTIVLAAGDVFSLALDPPEPVRVESGIGRVEQNGTINADGINGDGGSVTLTAGDNVVLGSGSLTTANGGTSNDGANGGEVVAYASELYANTAEVDFQAGAEIQVRGGTPSDSSVLTPEDTIEKFDGGLAEISGDHMYFNGTVDATSTSFDIPDPVNIGETITITPEGGTLHIDPVNLTLADGPIPVEGAAIDTFYEEELEAYSQAGVNTTLEADYDITVEHITDGVIEGGSGDIALRTVYNIGGIEFLSETAGEPVSTEVTTSGGGNIFMLAGSGGIVTGDLHTEENNGGNPGRIRIFTNNGGNISTGELTVDGGNNVEVSVIASGDLAINGQVLTSTNKVPADEDKSGTAYVCLVSENGSVNILGAVEVEAHGKEQTIAKIHICADDTITIDTGNGRISAISKTSSAGTADATVRLHAGSSEPDAISLTSNGDPIRVQANTQGSSIGPLDFTGAETTYEQTTGGSHVLVEIASAWLGDCTDCPVPPDLPPPVEPPQHVPVAVDDDYVIGKGDVLLIIIDEDGVLTNDYDPDTDTIIAILIGGGTTAQGGTIDLAETGGFTYTPPEEKTFDSFGSDSGGDYALFIDTFAYYVEDEGGLSSNNATVTITSKNYLPVAQSDSYSVPHNANLTKTADEGIIVGVVPAVNGDYDPDPEDTLSPYLSDGTTSGTTTEGGLITLNPDGSFSYEPPADWIGSDSFTYYASDGYNNSSPVQVSIEVGNATPVAQPDSYDTLHNVGLSTDAGQGIIIGVIPADNGDYDSDGDTLTPYLPGALTTGPTDLGGTVILNPDGSFDYTPPADTVGTDSFIYYVTDGYSNSATVQVTIELTNTIPTAQPDSYSTSYNTILSPTANLGIITGVVPAINGDFDPDPGDTLSPYLSDGTTSGTTAQGGVVTLNSDGSFNYEPPSGWTGADSFTYYISDGYDNSTPVEVSIEVGRRTPVASAFMPIAPLPEPIKIEVSGCPALTAMAASELGVDQETIQIWFANSLASGRNIQPCDACVRLNQAAAILRDTEGTHVTALAQLISEYASSSAPPTEEQMASIAYAIANNDEVGNQYAIAGEYLDAIVEYVGILHNEMALSTEDSIQLAADKYLEPLADGDNASVAIFIAAQLADLIQ